MPLQKIVFKPGVNRENTRYTNEGGWYESDKVRFRQGTPEKIGGWTRVSGNSYSGICRSLWVWSSLTGVIYTGVGTNLGFYILLGGAYNDITPIRSYSSLSNPFAATSGSTTITVTDAGHGMSTGDFVTYYGAVALSTQTFTYVSTTTFNLSSALATSTPVVLSSTGTLPTGLVAGVVYYILVVSGTTVSFTNTIGGAAITVSSTGTGTLSLYVNNGITASVLNSSFSVTVLTSNTYTITSPVAATTYDIGGGGTTVNAAHEISGGAAISQPLVGWGANTWGSGTWGVGLPTASNFRLWYQNNFGQDLVYGYQGGPLYYWSAQVGSTPVAVSSIAITSTTISSVNTSTYYITVGSTSGLSNGYGVKFVNSGGALPGGLGAGVTYYVINVNGAGANTLQVSTTVGGTAVTLTSAGTGTNTMYSQSLVTLNASVSENTALVFTSTGTLPTGMTIGTVYYAYLVSGSTFYLTTSPQGTPIVCTAAGTGTAYILPNGIPLSSLAYASDVPVAVNNMLVSDLSRFVIAFGCNPIGSTSIDPMFIRWSDQESATNWTPAVTNQAGGQRLSHGSKIVAAVQNRQEIAVFTDSSVYSMQYAGPPYVWAFQLIGDAISIASPNAAVLASGVTYWMGNDKFYRYDGRIQTIRCDLRQYVYNDINLSQASQIFSGTNEGFNEVWWFYCSANSTVINRYVVYNYLEDIWYYGTMSRSAWIDSGLLSYPIAATYINNVVYHEDGLDDNSTATPAPIDAYIGSSEFAIGNNNNIGFVWRMLPDISFVGSTATSPQVSMTLNPMINSGSGYSNPESTANSSTATVVRGVTIPVEQFTGQVYIRVRGRQLTFKVESTGLGTQWQLGASRIDIRPDGRRGDS
jgi:hypothetical protein